MTMFSKYFQEVTVAEELLQTAESFYGVFINSSLAGLLIAFEKSPKTRLN